MKNEKEPNDKKEPRPIRRPFFDEFFNSINKRSSFGFFNNFEENFKRMEQEMNELYQQAIQENNENRPNKNTRFYGWSYHIGPDGQPHFQEFGNLPELSDKPQQKQLPHNRNPHIDLQEDEQKIYVTAELPGVEKKDINLEITDTLLSIHVTNDTYPYHEEITLPTNVNENKTEATYNNGILSLTLEKKKQKKGRKIHIK